MEEKRPKNYSFAYARHYHVCQRYSAKRKFAIHVRSTPELQNLFGDNARVVS